MSDSGRRPISRAPVYITIGFFVVALTLVFVGAQLSTQRPAVAPTLGQPGTLASPRPVTVIMRDFLFEPVPLQLVPGETIRLTVFDAGLEAHELVLGDAATQAAWAAADAAATPPAPFATPPPASVPPGTPGLRILLRSGEQATVDWTVPSAGPLLLQCLLPGHLERGMAAPVVLHQAGPSGTPGQ
ncbi:MAG: hypothetical protein QOH61_822 [Chloroflexota bacterium]|nr:hypothetical protein [Chloroflexota bacterium]